MISRADWVPVSIRGPRLHIMSIALGGCLRAEPVQYGITEDTGGHITYILGEMEALARRDDVELAEIITRRFVDKRLGAIHAQSEEWISDTCVIRRIDSGDPRYLAKEALAQDRAAFIDALFADLRARSRLPDIVHAHFADAADIAAQIEREFGIPFIYTAHSLGLDKRAAVTAPGPELAAELDGRIAEEDRAIGAASAIIGSSRDECERQILAYPSARIGRVNRIVPGVKVPSVGQDARDRARDLIAPFLREPDKPIILAIARPVAKKNLAMLVEAFGRSPWLRAKANLVILAGLRDGIESGGAERRAVFSELLDTIDRHELYGSIAYPPRHAREDVEALFALARESGGVFVNPAKVEPYGLTLVEAAAHGVPVVATRIGGPIDILDQLDHGLLVDPDDPQDIADAIERLLDDRALWAEKSANALARVTAMTWEAYADHFVALARDILSREEPVNKVLSSLLVCDLDNTLTGCRIGVSRLREYLSRNSGVGFVLATGRSIVEAQRIVREWGLPRPRAWITSVGSELYVERHGEIERDLLFDRKIALGWDPAAVDEAVKGLKGLTPQPHYEQREFKRSFFADDPTVADALRVRLLERGIYARTVLSHATLLDILPIAGGKAAAMRHVAGRLGVDMRNVFAVGDSGNDEDMLSVCDNAIMVANHSQEIATLSDRANVYVARRSHANGALEGILAHQRRQRAAHRVEQVA